MLRLTNLSNDLFDKCDDCLVNVVSLVDGFENLVFGNFLCTGFDHDDLFLGGSNRHLKVAFFPLLLGRVDDELTVYEADLSHCAGAVKRNIGNAGRDRSAEHSYELGTAFGVNAHYHIVKGYVVTIILGEKRTHGAVDDTACKDRILACLTLTLIESSGDLSYRISLFFVFNRKREEIDPVSGLFGSCCCRKNRCVAVLHQSTAVCLLTYSVDVNA